MAKILCPFHDERTPSLEVYSDGFFCFGCGKGGTLAELEAEGVKGLAPTYKKPAENINESLTYINNLQKKLIRGFELPFDDSGYYVVWPDSSYYKKRLWTPIGKNKYYCPTGHKQPPFTLNPGNKTLFIVEGEINALSVSAAIPEVTVMSPGGTTQFSRNDLRLFAGYDNIICVVDKDVAGVIAYIELKSKLSSAGIDADSVFMEKDANEVLLGHGKEELRKILQNAR